MRLTGLGAFNKQTKQNNIPTDPSYPPWQGTSSLVIGRSEELIEEFETLILRAQHQGHHTIDRPEERGVERLKSAQRSSLLGREMATVNQTDNGTLSKATLEKLLRDGVERIWAFQGE